MDNYTSDLRATAQIGMDINVFPINRLSIPRDRIAKKLDLARPSLHYHLSKMATLPFSTNSNLSQGFIITQVFYFSKANDLILDPMAGGGVTPDTCLALGRRC